MPVRKNPLLHKPPVPKKGKPHRLGSSWDRTLRETFGDLNQNLDNLYKGVFVSPLPIVASSYAYSRRGMEENDFGYEDVVDPPVLLGLRIKEGDPAEDIDTDALLTAYVLLDEASKAVRQETDTEDEEWVELMQSEHCRSPFYGFDLDTNNMTNVGGDIGNRASVGAFISKVEELMELIADEGAEEDIADYSSEIRQAAMDAATEIIEQSRLIRDVYEDEIVSVVVLPPYKVSQEDDKNLPWKEDPLEEEEYESFTAGKTLSKFLLQDSTVIYGDPKKANRWHGTSLSIAQNAIPEIVTPELFAEAVRAGSLYDLEELEAELNEDADDE